MKTDAVAQTGLSSACVRDVGETLLTTSPKDRFDLFIRLATGIPILILLTLVILYGTAEKFHSQLLQIGEENWPGYREFRFDPEKPDCDPNAASIEGEAAPAQAPAEAEDELDDLFGEEEAGPSEEALAAARQACLDRVTSYEKVIVALENPNLRRYRWFETGVAEYVELGVNYVRHFLVLLIIFCAFTATIRRSHIALRTARSALSDRISQAGQLVSNVILAVSFRSMWLVNDESGTGETTQAMLPKLWLLGFTLMSIINVIYLIRPLRNDKQGESFAKASLTVPLYSGMAVISTGYFWFVESHIPGPAIFLGLLTEHALLYVNVGLYVWAGMLLKQTRIAEYLFDILRPWKLPPELLGFVVVAAAAIPTAYSGASGIFVIAAGAIIFFELRRAGARTQFAKAATAMSGSMGVLLSPCLLVVIVAALNKEVTTDQLFSWGVWVFLLNVVVFLAGCIMVRQGPLKTAPAAEAAPASLRALLPVLPYTLVGLAVVLGFKYGLETAFDEHSAPIILPVVLLVVLVYDRFMAKRAPDAPEKFERIAGEPPSRGKKGYFAALLDATAESSVQTGALLTLMGLSVVLGGIVERGEMMSFIPEAFGSTTTTMITLVFILIIIGMLMDPYGAVILVSSTIAAVAYNNGIDPTHFWLVVLSAFELGYLTPPVALNHLLTRQVIGEAEDIDDTTPDDPFWRRHERVLFPIAVKSVVLLAVAFIPLWI